MEEVSGGAGEKVGRGESGREKKIWLRMLEGGSAEGGGVEGVEGLGRFGAGGWKEEGLVRGGVKGAGELGGFGEK